MLGASAAVAVATVAAPTPALADDAVLLARIQQFHDVYGELQDVWGKHQAHRAAVEAMPDCPQIPFYRDRTAFLEAHDAYRGWEQGNRLNERTGALAKTIFGTPAQTAKGALEKLKIAYTAVGDGEETGTGDPDLGSFQDLKAPWMEAVIADFERLIEGMRS
jgi:hypothetical protein